MDSDEDCQNIINRITDALNYDTDTPSLLSHNLKLAEFETVSETQNILKSLNIAEEGSSLLKSGFEQDVPQWRKNLLTKGKSKSPAKAPLERIAEEERSKVGRFKRTEEVKEQWEDDIQLGLDIVAQYRKNKTKFKKETEKFKKISNEGKEEPAKILPKQLARHEQPYFRMEIRHKERQEKRAAALKPQKALNKKYELAVENVPPNRTQSRIQELREKREQKEREAQDLAELSKKVKDEVEKEVAEMKAIYRAEQQKEIERKRRQEYEKEMQRLQAERAKSLKDKKKFHLNKFTEILEMKLKRARLRILRRSWHCVCSFSAQMKMRLVKAGCSRRFSLMCRCFSGLAHYAREERIRRAEEEYLRMKKIQQAKKKRAAQLYETRLSKLGLRSMKLFVVISQREKEEEEREEKRRKKLQDFFESVQSRIDESRVLEQERKKQTQETEFEQVKESPLFDEASLSPIKECSESTHVQSYKIKSPESLKTITQQLCQTEREIKAIASPGQRYKNVIEEEEQEEKEEPHKEEKNEPRVKVSKIVLEMEKREAERKKKKQQRELRNKEREQQKQREKEEQKKKQEEDAKKQKQKKLREAREKKQAELKEKEEKREARLKQKERENQAMSYYLKQLQRRVLNRGFKSVLFWLRAKQARAGEKLRRSILARGWKRIEAYLNFQRELNYQREAHQLAVAITQYTYALKKRAYFGFREYLMISADELIIAQEKKEVGLALRCFENWKKAMPRLREERMLMEYKEEQLISTFQKIYKGRRVMRGWASFVEESVRERNKQKAKAELWAKVNMWRNK